MQNDEQLVGNWRRSVKTRGFWLRLIGSLGTYYFTLWRRNQISLTNRRLSQRIGNLLEDQEISMNVENIADIKIDHSIFGEMLGYGNIMIQSTGSDTPEIISFGLAHPKKLRDAIFVLQGDRRAK